MRILNLDNDTKVDQVILYLTKDNAEELRDSIGCLLNDPKNNHAHIYSEDYNKEITVCIYDLEELDEYGFNKRSKKIILEDK